MNNIQFVTVKIFYNEPEAKMAEAYLQTNHINTLLILEDPARMGIEQRALLKVSKQDLDTAKVLLDPKNT